MMTEQDGGPMEIDLGLPMKGCSSSGTTIKRLVGNGAKRNEWAVAHQLSLLLEDELRSDPTYKPSEPTIPACQCDLDVEVWLAIVDCHAVGFLAVRPYDLYQFKDDVDNGISNQWHPFPNGYRIVSIWLARHHRGKGFAPRLANDAAATYGFSPTEFVHSPPFSKSGLAFASKLSEGKIRTC